MSSFNAKNSNKKVVIFVMGATGTGKSRLAIDLAVHFNGEIINSDKMQVYKGLDVVTNKVSESEKRGVPHHLLGEIDPDSDFTALDFCHAALSTIQRTLRSGRVPIIVGGSNSFIEALVEDPLFKSTYSGCFLWLDVLLPILFSFVSKRVDQMVDQGLVNEVREIFVPGADYTRGIRRSIGVPELEKYFIEEPKLVETEKKEILLDSAIEEIKENTCKLVCCQLKKIQRLRDDFMWPMHRVDATPVFEKRGREATDDARNQLVLQPCLEIATEFLEVEKKNIAVAEKIGATFHSKQLPLAN